MRSLALAAILLTCCSCPAQNLSDIVETKARTAYARLSYATELNAVHTTVGEVTVKRKLPDPITLEELLKLVDPKILKFEIVMLKTGKVFEIWNTSIFDLTTKPTGEDELQIASITHSYRHDNGTETFAGYMATAKWQAGKALPKDWNYPVTLSMIAAQDQYPSGLTDYAKLQVTATFEDRTRTYNALFLCNQTECRSVDPVISAPVWWYGAHHVYPTLFLQPGWQKGQPVLKRWLEHNAMDGVDGGDPICDLVALRCGVPRSALLIGN
jgi:hypothetical protein